MGCQVGAGHDVPPIHADILVGRFLWIGGKENRQIGPKSSREYTQKAYKAIFLDSWHTGSLRFRSKPGMTGFICILAIPICESMERYFRHYKNGQLYKLLHIARIEAEPNKKAVVYQAMYGEKEIWIRPYENFFENVTVNGKEVPRFMEIK